MIKPHQILQGVIDGECTFVQFPKGSDKYHLFSSTLTFGSGSIQTQVFFWTHFNSDFFFYPTKISNGQPIWSYGRAYHQYFYEVTKIWVRPENKIVSTVIPRSAVPLTMFNS